MPEIVRERVVRGYAGRDRDDYSSDDDRSSYGRSRAGGSSYRTVQRYRVGGDHGDRVEPVDDFRRTSHIEIDRPGERVKIDRRTEVDRLRTSDRDRDRDRDRFYDGPERPRSSIDIRPARSSFVERDVTIEREKPRERERDTTFIERDRIIERERPRESPRETKYIERDRIIEREREPFREPTRDVRERERTLVVERDRPRSPDNSRPWERPHRPWEDERAVRETDVRIEKRTTERHDEPYELDRVTREIEYYDRPEPPPQPIIIRQRAPEPQQIIVQEAPPPAPIVIPREEQNYEIVRRTEVKQEVARPEPRPEPRREEEDYYYRRDVRVEGGRGRDDDYAMAKYDRREIRPHDSVSDRGYSDDEDYIVRRRIVKQRSRSGSSHRKRHLAEGALAGAGIAALVGNHRDKTGNGPEHRGRNVVGGAALGAIGAEVVTRARSRYRDRERDRHSRSRSRSSSRHSHTKVKTALGLAVAGLAAAAAAKYVSNRNQNKEELGRGRSRTRSRGRGRSSSYSSDYGSRARSKSVHTDPKHRNATIAKAGAATAIAAAVANHVRNKSRKRSGSRSKSRVRTGAEVVGAGLAGAAVAGLYENRKAKEENTEIQREVEHEHVKRERRRSRSRARSVGAYSDPGVDPELGMVQYGTDPVYTTTQHTTTYREFDDDDRDHRSRSHRRRHSSSSDDQRRGSRSRSRVRDIAGAAAGTAAAAIGINQYKKRKEKKEAQRERERRRYEEEPPDDYYSRDYVDDGYSPSPPHASGGSFYPDHNQFQPPQQPAYTPGFTQHPNLSTPNVGQSPLPTYNPADYAPGTGPAPQPPHDPYGYPPTVPRSGDNVSPRTTTHQYPPDPANPTMSGATPYFPPPPTTPLPQEPRHSEASTHVMVYTPPSSPESETSDHHRSVAFAPLSPTSSRRLSRIQQTHQDNLARSSTDLVTSPTPTPNTEHHHHHRRKRRNSDPGSSDRPSRHKNSSLSHQRDRSVSPTPSSDIEILPDRFDAHGRRIYPDDPPPPPNPNEMVERLVSDFTGVLEGRKSWKDMLRGVVEGAQGSGIAGIAGEGSKEGSRRRR